MPQITGDVAMESLVTFLVVFLCSSNYIQNPYLAAKLIEVLFVVNPDIQQHTVKINDMLLNHPLARQHLALALMKFYTGDISLLLTFQ